MANSPIIFGFYKTQLQYIFLLWWRKLHTNVQTHDTRVVHFATYTHSAVVKDHVHWTRCRSASSDRSLALKLEYCSFICGIHTASDPTRRWTNRTLLRTCPNMIPYAYRARRKHDTPGVQRALGYIQTGRVSVKPMVSLLYNNYDAVRPVWMLRLINMWSKTSAWCFKFTPSNCRSRVQSE